ncbi:hypothetical protein H6P81_004079 [Aristolochia fimbriata]|uniref:Uncharacterized protein n=1 Tax=Aristolochia fimbriata TaxID=158543 RepID=A0AAV7FHH9_ARIFI|nr:hypothetical protein H6P81_004079 [Aristolochia fimbriata]
MAIVTEKTRGAESKVWKNNSAREQWRAAEERWRSGGGGAVVEERWWRSGGGGAVVEERWWRSGGGGAVVEERWWRSGGGRIAYNSQIQTPNVQSRWSFEARNPSVKTSSDDSQPTSFVGRSINHKVQESRTNARCPFVLNFQSGLWPACTISDSVDSVGDKRRVAFQTHACYSLAKS